jgi:hypothetical protein
MTSDSKITKSDFTILHIETTAMVSRVCDWFSKQSKSQSSVRRIAGLRLRLGMTCTRVLYDKFLRIRTEKNMRFLRIHTEQVYSFSCVVY